MGIVLNWPDQSGQKLDAIEVYRGGSKISSSNPGSPIATLAGNAVTYEDQTVKNKNLYYYRIAAVKGGERAWGDNQLAAYFAETGPGRATVLRGDWNAGLMDTLIPADFSTMASIKSKIPGMAAMTIGEPTAWYKFVYKGKVLFFPNVANISATWASLYNAGLVYGTDDFGQTPTGSYGSVKQRTIVNINSLEYIVRLPRLSTIPLSQYLTATDDTIGGEFRDTFARLMLTTTTVNGQRTRLGDNTTGLLTLGPHLAAAGSCGAILAANQEVLSNGGLTTNCSHMLILELVMP